MNVKFENYLNLFATCIGIAWNNLSFDLDKLSQEKILLYLNYNKLLALRLDTSDSMHVSWTFLVLKTANFVSIHQVTLMTCPYCIYLFIYSECICNGHAFFPNIISQIEECCQNWWSFVRWIARERDGCIEVQGYIILDEMHEWSLESNLVLLCLQ